jgi:hypothetical protein
MEEPWSLLWPDDDPPERVLKTLLPPLKWRPSILVPATAVEEKHVVAQGCICGALGFGPHGEATLANNATKPGTGQYDILG